MCQLLLYQQKMKQLKSGFKRIIKWNKYRLEMTNQAKNNHLNYLIDQTFTKVNRLRVLSFENEEDKTSFSKYYVPKVETRVFNVLIDGKNFFDVPEKNKEKAYEKIMIISKIIITQFIGLWILFKTLKTNCNRFKQTNWINESWFKATN